MSNILHAQKAADANIRGYTKKRSEILEKIDKAAKVGETQLNIYEMLNADDVAWFTKLGYRIVETQPSQEERRLGEITGAFPTYYSAISPTTYFTPLGGYYFTIFWNE